MLINNKNAKATTFEKELTQNQYHSRLSTNLTHFRSRFPFNIPQKQKKLKISGDFLIFSGDIKREL